MCVGGHFCGERCGVGGCVRGEEGCEEKEGRRF